MSQDFMKQIGLLRTYRASLPPTLRIYGCGEILTLNRLEKKKEKSPDFAIMLSSMRVGSVWNKVSSNGKNYKTGTILNHLDLEKEIRFVVFPAQEKGKTIQYFCRKNTRPAIALENKKSQSLFFPHKKKGKTIQYLAQAARIHLNKAGALRADGSTRSSKKNCLFSDFRQVFRGEGGATAPLPDVCPPPNRGVEKSLNKTG